MSRRLLAVGVITLAAGCGSSSTRTVTAVPAVTGTTTARTVTLGASSGPTRCTDYLYRHSTVVTFSSRTADVKAVCRSWISVNAKEGEHWIVATGTNAPRPPGLKTVCMLDTRKGRITTVVEDVPGQVFGRAACAGLRSAGWTERSSG